MKRRINAGVQDLWLGLQRVPLWRTLAWYDLRRGNTKSTIGVLWHTLSFFIVIAFLGYLYSDIMGHPQETFVPYLAAGFLVWHYINHIITAGLLVFVGNKGFITQIPMPMSVFVFRNACYDLYVLGLNFVAYLLILLVFGLEPKIELLPALAGLLILMLTSVAVTLLLGVLSVFNLWMRNLIPSIMRLLFFVTPIIWMPQMLTGGEIASVMTQVGEVGVRAAIVLYNPFYHFVEILRSPLIGDPVATLSWVVTGLGAILLLAVAVWSMGHWRSRILLRL